MHIRIFSGLIAGLFSVALAMPSSADQSVGEFYNKRTVTIYVGYSPGGGYDLYGRLVARHLGRHVPGNPELIVKNMPGAGGLKMINWFYNAAPKDGSALASAPQALAVEQALGSRGIKYDAAKMNWIGRVTPITEVSYTWHTSATKTLQDAAKRVTPMGASGPTSPTATHLKELNGILGTKFKPITGYKGSSGANLAMERGEVEGTTKSWPSLKTRNANWVREGKLNILVQYALERDPDLPNVPLMSDLAKTPEDKQILDFFVVSNGMGRNVVAPAGVPADRTAALRKAFMEMMRDPKLTAEAKKRKISLGAMSGADVHKLVERTLGVSPALIASAKKVRK